MPRRFPPPWMVEEYRGISYIVRDANNFAKAEGISERTLYRAKRELKNVVARKDAADGGWTWRLCGEAEIK